MVVVRSPPPLRGKDLTTGTQFEVGAGERIAFTLTHSASHGGIPAPFDAERALKATEEHWQKWCERCTVKGEWAPFVRRSLITLKALTYAPTGGLVAAPTTSLPEEIGGVRNWDYRYCWLRDATLSLYALMLGGYEAEAVAWRDWLLRAVAGAPDQLQIMYGPAGQRRRPRPAIRADSCGQAHDATRATFPQSFGRPELDASLLMIPLVGFLPASDERAIGTVAAIERHLLADGFVLRYAGDSLGEVDGLPGGEGAFLPCTFWLADNFILQGRISEGHAL